MSNVVFCGFNCEVAKRKYSNGRTALELIAANDTDDVCKGEPIAMATVNIPEETLSPEEVIIKDYSENEGMLDVLLKAGIVELSGRSIRTGFVTCPICILKQV